MAERRALAIAAVVAGVALLAGPSRSAAAASCSPAKAPTRSTAWRAYIPPSTPIRDRPSSPASRARLTLLPAWRLVLASAHRRNGTCLIEVRLDRRPNTAHGWVDASRLRLTPTRWRIEVVRAARRATLRHAGHAVARWPVVVGAPTTPTPTGLFALQASYRTPPSSFEGAWILALTAHSDILSTFDGGDGQIALHGRGGPALQDPLGTAASHGCIRFDNHAISIIVRRIGRDRLPGVPVAIR
jgi:lipoprotein-anchoring transpeptidase ErfK/SrfK